jgi:hypothetical protein
MARSRNIKPGFFLNEELGECDPYARLLFISLWCLADREGRLECRPKRIKIQSLPYDDVDIDVLIEQLASKKLICVYRHGDNDYIQITGWAKHQNPHHKEIDSIIPSPNIPKNNDLSMLEPSMSQARPKHESSMSQDQVKQIASCPTDSLNLIPDSLDKEKINKKEKSVVRSLTAKQMLDYKPDDVDLETWAEFLQLRVRKKAEKTTRAMNGIIRKLDQCVENGVSRQSMLEMCLEKGWKGVDYQWYLKSEGVSYENSQSSSGKPLDPGARLVQRTFGETEF